MVFCGKAVVCSDHCIGRPRFCQSQTVRNLLLCHYTGVDSDKRRFTECRNFTAGVRCALRNEEVGGVSWSFHKRGHAADLYCPGVAVGDLAALAKEVGLNVLPYYNSGYVHVELME